MKRTLSFLIILCLLISSNQIAFGSPIILDALEIFFNELKAILTSASSVVSLTVERSSNTLTVKALVQYEPMAIKVAELVVKNPTIQEAKTMVAYILEKIIFHERLGMLNLNRMRSAINAALKRLGLALGETIHSGLGSLFSSEALLVYLAGMNLTCLALNDVKSTYAARIDELILELGGYNDQYFNLYKCDDPNSPKYGEFICLDLKRIRQELLDEIGDLDIAFNILKDYLNKKCPGPIQPPPSPLEMKTLNVAVDSANNWDRVVGGPFGTSQYISCTKRAGPGCSKDFLERSVIKLKAQASPNSRFLHWVGDACNGLTLPICDVVLNTSKNVTAYFEQVATRCSTPPCPTRAQTPAQRGLRSPTTRPIQPRGFSWRPFAPLFGGY